MLRHFYETRARSYRDVVQQFIEGYKEGFAGQSAENTEGDAQPGIQKQDLQSKSVADPASKQSGQSPSN